MNDFRWTWMSGADVHNHRGVVDKIGIPSTAFTPGARGGAVGGYDNLSKEIWLFSGEAVHGKRFFCFYFHQITPLTLSW